MPSAWNKETTAPAGEVLSSDGVRLTRVPSAGSREHLGKGSQALPALLTNTQLTEACRETRDEQPDPAAHCHTHARSERLSQRLLLLLQKNSNHCSSPELQPQNTPTARARGCQSRAPLPHHPSSLCPSLLLQLP